MSDEQVISAYEGFFEAVSGEGFSVKSKEAEGVWKFCIGGIDLYMFKQVVIGFYDTNMKTGTFMEFEKLGADGRTDRHELRQGHIDAAMEAARNVRNLITVEPRMKVLDMAFAAVANEIKEKELQHG